MDFINYEDMDFGTQRKSKCGICGKREKGAWGQWVDGVMEGDIICAVCDDIWVYDENRDGYVKFPIVAFAVDPENGMFICPCGKEADDTIIKVMRVKKSKKCGEREYLFSERIKCYVCSSC